MKATPIIFSLKLKDSQYWLLGIGAGLIAVHLSLTTKADQTSLLGSSFVFWIAISSLIWDKRHQLNFESGVFASIVGLILIVLALLKSAFPINTGGVAYLFPIVAALGLALIASGFKGLKQYRGELIALFFLAAPKLIPPSLMDLSLTTAKLSTAMLWYSGFHVVRSGVQINLPSGNVIVNFPCSGTEQVFHLLGLAIIALIMFPMKKWQKILVPIVAAVLAFIVNGIRVALMAILVNLGDKEAFKYWHGGDGSLVFSLISVTIFGCFCLFLLSKNNKKSPLKSVG